MLRTEDILRDAGRQLRRVLIQFHSSSGREYEREMEPYAIRDGELVAFSYLRDEFRTVKLGEITGVEITPRSFTPRREIEL
ncbi:MAG: WYL domain-containing protein [Gemmatimonadaceae bacterium]